MLQSHRLYRFQVLGQEPDSPERAPIYAAHDDFCQRPVKLRSEQLPATLPIQRLQAIESLNDAEVELFGCGEYLYLASTTETAAQSALKKLQDLSLFLAYRGIADRPQPYPRPKPGASPKTDLDSTQEKTKLRNWIVIPVLLIFLLPVLWVVILRFTNWFEIDYRDTD